MIGGGVIGAIVAGTLTGETGRSVAAAASDAVVAAAPSAALLTLAAAAVAVAVLLWADAQARSVWRLLDVLALACLGAMLLATDRGSATSSSLAGAGDPLVVALPVLASVVAGLVAARLWAPAARLAERVLPRASVAARMGLLGAIRRPLRPVATVAFLTAATASVVFAGAYRATLLANNADQAAYQVPLDVTVSGSDTQLVPSVDPNAFGPSGHVYGVRRTAAGVTRLAGVVDARPVIAVDAEALPHVRDWNRTTGASISASALAHDLHPTRTASTATAGGDAQLAIDVTGYDHHSAVRIWLGTTGGREFTCRSNTAARNSSPQRPTVRAPSWRSASTRASATRRTAATRPVRARPISLRCRAPCTSVRSMPTASPSRPPGRVGVPCAARRLRRQLASISVTRSTVPR